MGPGLGSSGPGGTIGNQQMGFGNGYQNQTIGGNGAQYVGLPILGQQQGFGLGFGGSLYNFGGITGAGGLGLIPGFSGQMQMSLSPDGMSSQFETVFGIQFGWLVGGDSDSSMDKSLDVSTEQFQIH